MTLNYFQVAVKLPRNLKQEVFDIFNSRSLVVINGGLNDIKENGIYFLNNCGSANYVYIRSFNQPSLPDVMYNFKYNGEKYLYVIEYYDEDECLLRDISRKLNFKKYLNTVDILLTNKTIFVKLHDNFRMQYGHTIETLFQYNEIVEPDDMGGDLLFTKIIGRTKY